MLWEMDGHVSHANNSEKIYKVNDAQSHRDKPGFMFPWAGIKEHEYNPLVKLLQSRATVINTHITVILRIIKNSVSDAASNVQLVERCYFDIQHVKNPPAG